ncbi:hypothetical protein, partial [Brevundimonas bullata]|uniref:hypothetical protein n=1 Tax=Brevundimonas bullata TaxID=13160 RepID=UPI002FD91E96
TRAGKLQPRMLQKTGADHGSGSFTYKWTAVRQQGNVNLTGSSGGFLTATLTPRIAGGVGANAAWDGYAYCDVTDTATGVVVRSANATINLFIESDGGGGGIEI